MARKQWDKVKVDLTPEGAKEKLPPVDALISGVEGAHAPAGHHRVVVRFEELPNGKHKGGDHILVKNSQILTPAESKAEDKKEAKEKKAAEK
jgi:hypothetical protein